MENWQLEMIISAHQPRSFMKAMLKTSMPAYAASLGVLVLLSGCGESHPATAPVSGIITFAGKPVPGGTVMFVPEPPGAPAYGEIQPDGSYRLSTFSEGDGAILGEHRIAISAVDIPNPELPEARALVPFKYSSEQTSGLRAEITKQEMNAVDLNL